MKRLYLLLLLSGCGDKINPGAVTDTSRCSLISQITYAETITPILTRYCTECHSSAVRDRHGAPVTINYNTYNQAKKNAVTGLQAMSSQSMPPDGPNVTELELCEFSRWINEGYTQ